MSSGSYFTLYRKYNCKATAEEAAKIKRKYADEANKLYGELREDKSDDIPLVLDPLYGEAPTKYDEATKSWIDVADHSIVGQRARRHFMLEDGTYLDELLEWHFGSSFSCLVDTWNLKRYSYTGSQRIVTKDEAKQILQAAKYLLSGKWSDEMEDIIGPEWIEVLSESYWKYSYRHDKNALSELLRDDAGSTDYALKRVVNVLTAFLDADEDYSEDKTEFILVYTAY